MKKSLIIIGIVIAALIVLYLLAHLLPVGMMLPFFVGAGAGAIATIGGRYLWEKIKDKIGA